MTADLSTSIFSPNNSKVTEPKFTPEQIGTVSKLLKEINFMNLTTLLQIIAWLVITAMFGVLIYYNKKL